MKSKKYIDLIKSVNESIKQGKQDSLLNRMQFDYQIRNKNEFSNYLVIVMALMENGNYEISNNIFLRKVINSLEKYDSFLGDINNTFDLIKLNSVFPFVGISNTMASFIMDFIDNSENVNHFKDKIPEKYHLMLLNYEFLKMYFRECADRLWFRDYIRLLYNCIYDIDLGSREVKLYDEATQFMKGILINKNDVFINYLRHFLRSGGMKYSVPNFSSLQIVPEPYFLEIFGSIDEFEVRVRLSKSNLEKDILEFLSKYRENKKVFLQDLNLNKEHHELLRIEM